MKKIDHSIETVFIMTDERYSCLSSSGVREMLYFGGDITGFVPPSIKDDIMKRARSAQ